MTLTRFAQLWQALVTDRALPSRQGEPIPSMPMSRDLEEALIAVSHGDHSHFDRIQLELDRWDRS